MNDVNMSAKRSALKLFGLCGAVFVPVVMGILTLSPIPRDTAIFSIIQKVVFYGAWPVIIFIYKGLPALGIEGDQGLAYIVPIFVIFFLYWALIGFILGALLAGISKMINKAQQGGPGYPPQGVGSPDP